MIKMTVDVMSGISSDGFNVTICNEDEKVFEKGYRYGYTASYDKIFANERQPFVSDILDDLIEKYGVEKMEIQAGKNVFRGDNVDEDDVTHFKETYCKTFLTELAMSDVPVLTDKDLEGLTSETGLEQ